jgi:hypothetical protein
MVILFLNYFGYFEPYLYPLHFLKGKAEIVSYNVIIGPYPTKKELERLKNKFSVTTVISLFNPSLPQEKSLIEREDKITRELKLKFYNFPLEYVNLKGEHNRKVLSDLLKFLQKNPNEKYYIHCYLGKHRTEFVKMAIKKRELK